MHDGCYDFWFDALSLVDIIVVLLDWLLMLSENHKLPLLGSGRVFKALRILHVRMARTTRAAIALQQDFRRPLAYRDLFALEILENEFKHLETELREDREDWVSMSAKARYHTVVAQAIATRLQNVCGFDVALIHKDNRLVCLVGSGEADLLKEAALVDYKLQLHNNPVRRSRIKKASELCDPKEKVASSMRKGRIWLSRKLAVDKTRSLMSSSGFPSNRNSSLGGFDTKTDLDFSSMFKDRIALDPHLSRTLQKCLTRSL